MKLNLQLFGGRGQSKGGKRLTLSQRQKEAGERLTRNAEKGAMSDIKDFLSGRTDYDGTQQDFIRDLSNEWGISKERAEELLHDENLKHPRNFKPRTTSGEMVKVNGKDVKTYNNVPKGYTKIEGAQTAPKGYDWYSNGKSRFSGEYKSILVKKKK